MSEDLNCCGETSPTNPKRDHFGRKTKKADHLFSLRNPIPDEVKDADTLKKIFRSYNLIPYAGTSADSSHTLLTWYNMLAKLSPTNAAAINKKIEFALGGKAKIVASEDSEFETGEEKRTVSIAEAKAYIDDLKNFVVFKGGGISKVAGMSAWQYEANGNSFVEMSVSSVMGQIRVAIKAHKTTHCLFVNTEHGEPKAIAISPVWTDKYLSDHEPRIIPQYPVFVADNEDGVMRTFFHLKHGDNDWYGRPPSEGADLYKYREFQDAMYLIRAAATNFTGQLVIEVEDDNPEFAPGLDDPSAEAAGMDSFVNRFEKNFTNKGDDPQSVVIASRPYGSRPMFVFQVSPNTKEEWYKVTGEIAENKILRAHQITPRFLGFDVANGFATDVYISDYLMNVQPVIRGLHDEIMVFLNTIISAAWQIVGKPENNMLSVAFSEPIQGAIDDFKKSNQAQQTPAQ